MAIVADKSGNNPFPLDNRLTSPSATLAASPVGSRTPTFCGEIVVDTTNNINYRAYGTTSASWKPVYPER